MNTTSIKRSIGQCEDTDALHEIANACRARIKLVANRKFEENKATAWGAIKDAKNGDVLFSHWHGFGGRGIVNGDRLEVHLVQPRKLLLWVKNPRKAGQFIGLTPRDVVIYDIRKGLVEKPLDETTRASHTAFNEAIAEVLK